jgi:hypothetical protein
MSGANMVVKLKHILDKFALTHKIVGFVKNERPNLQTCAQALKVVVFCHHLDTTKPFDGHFFGHTLSKVCQYATSDDKVARELQYALIKSTQANIHKYITWLKKSNKGNQEWEKPYMDICLSPHKLNTSVKTKYLEILHVLLFQFDLFGFDCQVVLLSFHFSMVCFELI